MRAHDKWGMPIKSAITIGKYEELLSKTPSIHSVFRFVHELSHWIQVLVVVEIVVVVIVVAVVVIVIAAAVVTVVVVVIAVVVVVAATVVDAAAVVAGAATAAAARLILVNDPVITRTASYNLDIAPSGST